jgi:hypothetical protein
LTEIATHDNKVEAGELLAIQDPRNPIPDEIEVRVWRRQMYV